MEQIKQFSSEEELHQYIDEYYKEKEIKLEAYRILNDDEDNETAGKCTQGCPQIYEDNTDLIVICWSEEAVLRESLEPFLLDAFLKANNHRLMSAINRNKQISNTPWYEPSPRKIPFIDEKTLSRAEIITFSDTELKYNKTYNQMVNELIDRLEQQRLMDAKKRDGLWDGTKSTLDSLYDSGVNIAENISDGAALVYAIAEVTVTSGVDAAVFGLQGAGSLGIGIGVAALNLDFEKGIDAAIGTFDELRAETKDIENSDFTKGVLQRSDTVKTLGAGLEYQSEKFYKTVGEMYGYNAETWTRATYGAGGKIMALVGPAPAAKAIIGSAKGTTTILGRPLKPAKNIYLKTADTEKIIDSLRVWGQTEGSVYATEYANASRLMTFIDVKKVDVSLIHMTGDAAKLFKPHEVTGIFSGIKRLTGQYKAPFGDIIITEGGYSYNATSKVLTIDKATIGSHAGQSTGEALKRLWGRRLGIDNVLMNGPFAGAIYLHQKNKE